MWSPATCSHWPRFVRSLRRDQHAGQWARAPRGQSVSPEAGEANRISPVKTGSLELCSSSRGDKENKETQNAASEANARTHADACETTRRSNAWLVKLDLSEREMPGID